MTQVTGNGSQMGSYRWDSDERKSVQLNEHLRVEVGTLVPRAHFLVAGGVLAVGTIGMNKVSTLRP